MNYKSVKTLYFQNIFLFLLSGIVIALITSYINYINSFQIAEIKIQKESKIKSDNIKNSIKKYIDKVENSISSVKTNEIFINYLLNSNSEMAKSSAENLFLNTILNNQDFFQFRFIDKSGLEKIRIEQKTGTKETFIVEESKLQDKSKRYYFRETIVNNLNFWYSSLDLNIENGEIEKPLKPTYRVSSNVFYKGKFYGIVIANIDMKRLFAEIKNNSQFYVYLIDKYNNFILHNDPKKEWNKYLHNGFIFSESNDKNHNMYLLEEFFKNQENIKLILKAKEQYLTSIENNNLKYTYTIGLIILIISIPIGFLTSIPTSKLYLKTNKLFKSNQRYIDTIDKYVNTMTVGLDKKISYVSTALCELTGYSKYELIGQKPSIFKSGKNDNLVYTDLWNKIQHGQIWVGELENRKKNGEIYWFRTTILPDFGEKNEIISYTSLSEDITDKKEIERISQTDKLTQLFNRLKLDEVLESEVNRFLRYKSIFSIILIDMDKFKSVNDTYGHLVGDSVLIELANLLQSQSRKTDIVGRWGGEEFLIICPNTNLDGAKHFAENIRISVEKFNFKHIGHKTISLGVTEIKDTDNIKILVKRADDYLYEAKKSGRNKVIWQIPTN
jgi:diguanylate cyclase (GGDEF)-like protein/PAS domain S-box-containing protein